MHSDDEAVFEARIRKGGNSFVITVPKEAMEKLGLKEKSGIAVLIKAWKKKT